jgi:uncharacterized protein with HEPN domain
MTDQGRKYLSDILQAIKLIEQFTSETKGYIEFISDPKTQSAVERQLGIIGEAIHKFDKLSTGISIENAEKIYGMRNRLVHAYDSVDSSIIWAILKKHLKPLEEEVKQKIK